MRRTGILAIYYFMKVFRVFNVGWLHESILTSVYVNVSFFTILAIKILQNRLF